MPQVQNVFEFCIVSFQEVEIVVRAEEMSLLTAMCWFPLLEHRALRCGESAVRPTQNYIVFGEALWVAALPVKNAFSFCSATTMPLPCLTFVKRLRFVDVENGELSVAVVFCDERHPHVAVRAVRAHRRAVLAPREAHARRALHFAGDGEQVTLDHGEFLTRVQTHRLERCKARKRLVRQADWIWLV